jgi:hypothetical protein
MGGDHHVISLLGTPRACGTLLCRECAEPAEFNAVAFLERTDNFIQDKVDDALQVTLVEMRALDRQLLDEFGLEHGGELSG